MKLMNLIPRFVYVVVVWFSIMSAAVAIEIDTVVGDVDKAVTTPDLLQRAQSLIGEPESYWPWWLGAIILGSIVFMFWFVVRIPMSGSSSWQRLVGWREEMARQNIEKEIHNASTADVMQAMMAETIAEFGEDSIDQMAAGASVEEKISMANDIPKRAPWHAHITFLLRMMVGGLVASFTTGEFELQMNMGSDYARYFGDGWHVWVILVFGGILIGFGTRMAGGCTIGHGLSGLSRLQVGSLLGTASFMGGAIVVSILVEYFLA